MQHSYKQKLLELEGEGLSQGYHGNREEVVPVQLLFSPTARFQLRRRVCPVHFWSPGQVDLLTPGPYTSV